jgi:hypothetical protein
MIETIIGVVLGWSLARLDRVIGDRQRRRREETMQRRVLRQASLRLIAELRAAQTTYQARFSPRLMPTDAWNRYGDALAEEPERWDEYLVVSDAYETIDLANHGDRTKEEAAGAASAAEIALRSLLIDLETAEAAQQAGGLGKALRRLRSRSRRPLAEVDAGQTPDPE